MPASRPWIPDYWVNWAIGLLPASGEAVINEHDLEQVNESIDGYLKYLRESASGGSRCFILDYGTNEKSCGAILMSYADNENLRENDEIYLDITHAFRSIPFLFT